MSYIYIAGNTTEFAASLDVRLLKLWQSYRELPEWAIKYITFTLGMIGTIANTLLLIYFYNSGKYRIPVFTLFTGLAVCDWTVCFSNLFIVIVLIPESIFISGGVEVCKIIVYFVVTSYHASLCHLIFLAGLRYFQLCHPLQAQAMVTCSLISKRCVSMWVFCAVISIPYAVYYTLHYITYEGTALGILYFAGNYGIKEAFISIFCETVPLVIISSLHLLKLYRVSKSPSHTQQQRRTGSSTIVAIIITLFVISIIPRMVHSLYHSVLGYPYLPLHMAISIYCGYFSYINSIFNPFVYILSSEEIRSNITKTFCRRCIKHG